MRAVHTKVRRSTKGLAVGLLAVGLLAAGCSSSDDGDDTSTDTSTGSAGPDAMAEEGTPVEGGSMTIAVAAETDGWNPATSQWAGEGNLVGSSFLEPLMVYNADGEAVPWLAESVTRNDDATVWTITLREGITFQDGAEMDAEAVVASMKFMASDVGLSSLVTKKLVGEPVVTGPYTLEVPLQIRWGAFPSQLTGTNGYVLAPSMLEKENFGTDAPVGTGAYEFEKAEKDRFVRVNAYDDYWGGPCTVADPGEDVVGLCEDLGVPLGQPNGPFLDSMEFRPITDSLQRVQALQSGDVDMILTYRAQDAADLGADYQIATDYDSEQTFVMLSTDKDPFDNIHARKALAHATDRAALLESFGAGQPVGSDTSPYEEDNFWGGLAPDETGYPLFDQDKAREEVELYKADTGAESLSFTLTGLATTDDIQLMQSVAEQWAEVGIEAQVEGIKQEALIPVLIGGQGQAILYRNYAYPDPDQHYVFWASDFAEPPIIINFSQWYNEVTEASLALGRQATDVELRKTAYDELVKERNANVIDVWLFNTPVALIAEPDIRGLNAFRSISFAGFYAKPWVTGLWVDPEA